MSKYTVLFSDAIPGGGGYLPDAPAPENQSPTIEGARALFRAWLEVSGNDYQRGQGCGAPSAWVYLTRAYDGVAYGDYPEAVFEYGPRGGIVRVSI